MMFNRSKLPPLVVAALIVTLAACGVAPSDTSAAPTTTPPTTAAPTTTVAPVPSSTPSEEEDDSYIITPPELTGRGWDVSFGQCSGALPDRGDFAVVGVNEYLPTQFNPCFADQMRWAAPAPNGEPEGPILLYVNAANPAGLGVATWPQSGTNRYGTCDGSSSEACSYEYGQARIAADLEQIGTYMRADTTVFIVVEREFSWDDGQQTLPSNTATIVGMADAIFDAGGQAGIYSTGADWHELMDPIGPDDRLFGLPVWWRGATTLDEARDNCGQTSFTGGPVVLAQVAGELADNPWGIDENVAC